MPKNSQPRSKLTMSAPETALYLKTELGGDESQWTIWLANDRKPTRVKKQLPHEPGPGRPRYDAALVEAFVVDYRKKLAQAGQVEVKENVTKSRRFAAHISALTIEEGADVPSVLLVIANPLIAFKLSVDEARHIARRLNVAADAIEAENAR
jgi:hypothetical protein